MAEQHFFHAYASSATLHFSQPDLAHLLAVSRTNNERAGVTGLLLHDGGNFLQALEGPESAVRRTIERIARDPRHRAIETLYEGAEDGRLFGEWAMAFEKGGGTDSAPLAGFSTFLDPVKRASATNSATWEAHDAFEFFRSFREHMR